MRSSVSPVGIVSNSSRRGGAGDDDDDNDDDNGDEAKSRRLMRPMVHPFIIRLKCDILRRRELNERKRRKLFSHYSRSDRVLSPERWMNLDLKIPLFFGREIQESPKHTEQKKRRGGVPILCVFSNLCAVTIISRGWCVNFVRVINFLRGDTCISGEVGQCCAR